MGASISRPRAAILGDRQMERDEIEKRAFAAWQTVQSLQFDLLMAYKYGAHDSLGYATAKLERALAELKEPTA